jgi:hypothetical protein
MLYLKDRSGVLTLRTDPWFSHRRLSRDRMFIHKRKVEWLLKVQKGYRNVNCGSGFMTAISGIY